MEEEKKEDLTEYTTVSSLLMSYKKHMECGSVSRLIDKVNSMKEDERDYISEDTVKKWSSGEVIPSEENLRKLFLDKDYFMRAQAIIGKMKRDRKTRRRQDKLISGKTVPIVEASPTGQDSKEPEQGFSDNECSLIEISDDDYPNEPGQDDVFHSLYLIEKGLRAYNESAYIRSMDLTKDVTEDIEALIKVIFDKKEISVFRYSVPFFLADYTMIGTKMELIDEYHDRTKYYPYGTDEYVISRQNSIRNIMDGYLYHMSNGEYHYGDLYEAVREYKHWRCLNARFDTSDPLHPRCLSANEYRKRLIESKPSFDSRYYLLQDVPAIHMTLSDIYDLCKIAADWKDSSIIRAYAKDDRIEENSFAYDDAYNKCPKNIINYGYYEYSQADNYFPTAYENLLNRLIEKQVSTIPYTKTRKKLFGSKMAGEGNIYTIGLKLKPLGIEFIKWYERTFKKIFKAGFLNDGIRLNVSRKDMNMNKMTKTHKRNDEPISSKEIIDIHAPHMATPDDYKEFHKKFMDSNKDMNLLLSKNLAMSTDIKLTNRTTNALVIGGTGSGKTFRYIEPNIAQFNCSRVIIDPTGDIFHSFSPSLIKQGKNIYLFDIKDFEYSNHYNPLAYLYNDDGTISGVKVDVLTNVYMETTSEDSDIRMSDPFWQKGKLAYIKALIYYVLENDNIPIEKKCFKTILEKTKLAASDFNAFMAEMNEFINRMKSENREIMTPLYLDTFLILPVKLHDNVLLSTIVDLAIFGKPEIGEITSTSSIYKDRNIDFDDLAKTETYLFISMPNSNKSYNKITTMLFSQLISRLYELGEYGLTDKWCIYKDKGFPVVNPFDTKEEAEQFRQEVTEENIISLPYMNNTNIYYLTWNGKIYKKSFSKDALERLINDVKDCQIGNTNSYWDCPALPMRVEFMLDDFTTYHILNFDVVMATCRRYRIGMHIILQDIEQLKEKYPEEYQAVLANTDITVFMGSRNRINHEYIQKLAGKTLITDSDGKKKWKEIQVISDGILEKMKSDECIVIIRDLNPFLDKKLDFSEHPNYDMIKNTKAFTDKAFTESYFKDVDII